MNCMIVDDSPGDRELLSNYIQQTPDLELVASFEQGLPALNAVPEQPNLDLIFLDIDMPDISGLDFLQALRSPWLPLVVFTSGHTKEAIRGINEHGRVVGFLEKIFTYPHFFRVVQKVQRLLHSYDTSSSFHALASSSNHTTMFVKTAYNRKERYEQINLAELVFIKSERNYARLVTSHTELLVKHGLGELEKKFSSQGFLRVHKSYVVNLAGVRRLEGSQLWLTNEQTIPVSDSYRATLLERISGFLVEDR